ncbi:MAG TPA: IS3 family transposase [Thermoplasmataceae archaeon]|nr:IS3 family transposase [Thermoplasmataceae archaeon]
MNDLVSKGFPKSRSAYLTGIARSMIYYQRRKREPQYDADLERRISGIVEERPSYGTRRVVAMIRRSGFRIGRNRVRRHMRHMNLITTHKKAHRKHAPRTIVAARPNIMWETDFTEVYIDSEVWVHLTAYLDLCSRKIKGYLVSRMSRTAEMIEALDNALLGTFPDMNVTGLIIRSDNGSQLTSSGYEKHLRTLGIKHETIHAHTPEEDGHIESYFGRFKDDYIYTREFVSFEDFRKHMEWAVSDYNTKRPHSSLNYMTPEEFESAILNEDFKKKWLEKETGRYKHVELLE